jgi:hypothetical protein
MKNRILASADIASLVVLGGCTTANNTQAAAANNMEAISDNIDAVADNKTVDNDKEALLEQGRRDERSRRQCHGRQSGCGERAGQKRDVTTALSLRWEFDLAALSGVALLCLRAGDRNARATKTHIRH